MLCLALYAVSLEDGGEPVPPLLPHLAVEGGHLPLEGGGEQGELRPQGGGLVTHLHVASGAQLM